MTPSTVPPPGRTQALTTLLRRYLAGDIAEQAWRRISAVLDTEHASPEERLAFASSVNHWLDRRDEGSRFPSLDDIRRSLGR